MTTTQVPRHLGLIGLGRMGLGVAQRLRRSGIRVHGYAPSTASRAKAKKVGVKTYQSTSELLSALPAPRLLWLLVPEAAIDGILDRKTGIGALLRRGDIVVDGGNTFFRHSQRRARALAKRGIAFIDCGTSGGVHGAVNGFCLMVGGERRAVKRLEPIFRRLATPGGYGYFGPSGAGHFVKSVHNIIEYGYLQALGEGIQLLKDSPYRIDVHRAASVWEHGSVVRSWLVELATVALGRPDFQKLSDVIGSVTTQELERTRRAVGTPAPAFAAAVRERRSRSPKLRFSRRLIAAIRREFGGHAVKK
ncbi:MAG: NADP-dependent phosphogluconate dehydrogenase [Candidatus Kerfeldbacteria bacterium]|nr:NADP-dependent phosphogluconate dehydrogenase [Candidatus Kerfeldbacteria bacterium]